MVISMTTRAEMEAVGAGHFGNDVQDMGAQWVHLPTADFSTPDPDGERIWTTTAGPSLTTLRAGGRVLVHCKGGCGRSGMVVLRLMIAAGEAPSEALHRLRAARPCAIETEAQMNWANGTLTGT